MNNDVIYNVPKLVHLIEYRNNYQSLVTLFRTFELQVLGTWVERKQQDGQIYSGHCVFEHCCDLPPPTTECATLIMAIENIFCVALMFIIFTIVNRN